MARLSSVARRRVAPLRHLSTEIARLPMTMSSTTAAARLCSRPATSTSMRSTRRARPRRRLRSRGCAIRSRARCSCSSAFGALPAPQPTTAPTPHADLDAAMHRHWTEQLRDGKRHARQVFVALREATPGALDSACAHATDRLSALGISAARLAGDALFAAVADNFDGNSSARWHEDAQHLAVDDLLIRGHALRRLPGHPVDAGWLAPLLRVQAECDIAIHLAPARLGDALGRLNRRLRDFSAHRMLEMERGALADVHVDIGLDAATALRERLARNLGRPAAPLRRRDRTGPLARRARRGQRRSPPWIRRRPRRRRGHALPPPGRIREHDCRSAWTHCAQANWSTRSRRRRAFPGSTQAARIPTATGSAR